MKLSFFGQMRVNAEGKLIHKKKLGDHMHKEFLKNLKEGDIVDVFMEVSSDDGTLAQLAKAHATLRDLSKFTGMSVEELKLVVKEKCGLCYIRTVGDKEVLYCKSLGDLGKDDLSLFIEEIYRLGESMGCPLF